MANNAVPTLSSTGWVSGIAQKADKLFTYFLTSERSQSNAFDGIASLQYLMQQYGDDELVLERKIEQTLSQLYRRYFEGVEVKARVREPQAEARDNRLDLTLKVLVNDGKYKYNLSKLLKSANGSLTRIIDLED